MWQLASSYTSMIQLLSLQKCSRFNQYGDSLCIMEGMGIAALISNSQFLCDFWVNLWAWSGRATIRRRLLPWFKPSWLYGGGWRLHTTPATPTSNTGRVELQLSIQHCRQHKSSRGLLFTQGEVRCHRYIKHSQLQSSADNANKGVHISNISRKQLMVLWCILFWLSWRVKQLGMAYLAIVNGTPFTNKF